MRNKLNVFSIIPVILAACFAFVAGGVGAILAIHKTFESRIARIEYSNSMCIQRIRYQRELVETEIARLNEFQEWRVTITLASRKGWGAANKYIASQWQYLPREWRYAERTTQGPKRNGK